MASLLTRTVARAAVPSYVRRLAAPVAAAPEALKQTALFDSHVALGGKMVPFAGYEMPVEYAGEGIKDSHLFVRSSAGLFDVSHMGQIRLHGADRVRFLETLVVADVAGLAPGAATLSLFTTATGGIIDDTIITNLKDENATGLVINAGCKDKDIKHIREHLEGARTRGLDVALEIIEDRELLALQGPRAMDALAALLGAGGGGGKNMGIDLTRMAFMTARPMDLVGATCLVTRCGYTGEDGFEISVPKTHVRELFDALLARDDVRPAGLGARDSLRLEAGLCLYGNDIDDTTTPIEAGLTWTVGKRRREEGGFLGADVILGQLRDGADRRRVAFEVPKGAPARGHEAICNEDGEEIGMVTSGCYSPSLGRAIGMGYCKKPYVKAGTPIQFKVRNRTVDAVIRKMPLVPSNYYKVPA